jgi:hypothetical protein
MCIDNITYLSGYFTRSSDKIPIGIEDTGVTLVGLLVCTQN